MPVAITKPNPDNKVENAVKNGLASFLKTSDPAWQPLLNAAAGTGGERLGVFTLGASAVLAGGSFLTRARFGGWRIAAGAGGSAAAADIYTMERKGPVPIPEGEPRLACVRIGPQIGNLLRAIEVVPAAAAGEPQMSGAYKLHLVLMPQLFTEALYLESENPSAAHWVFPYYTLIRKNLSVRTLYTEATFVDKVGPVARKQVGFDYDAIIEREKAATRAHLGI